MFTGLIEKVCQVKSAHRTGDSLKLSVDISSLAGQSKAGDSIAVNGACLTVTAVNGVVADFDVSGETLGKSNLGEINSGSVVNIERAMKADGRFGGHFVQGHVDGTAKIEKIAQEGEFWRIRFGADKNLLGQMVNKGSVAVDGISLTIASMNDKGFEVAVIPETFRKTTLGKAKIGDLVNIEIDLIVKVIQKQLSNILPAKEGLTLEKLQDLGF
ncbi:MAG: riboflavin synthase [Sedimentisphaerales bacterium]|nr:riboflavin synthase [Sedimentisphaerales bacterium]